MRGESDASFQSAHPLATHGGHLHNVGHVAQDVHVTGVDANPAMQSYCRAAADAASLPESSLNLVVGDVAALPFPDASFDAVVCTLVLLSSLQRWLRPGMPLAPWRLHC